MKIFRAIPILALLTAHQAWAGDALDVLKSEMKPVTHTVNGRLEMCGVHFSASLASNKEQLAIHGSLNVAFYKDSFPTVVAKFTTHRWSRGELIPQPLSNAFMMKGAFSTAKFKGSNGDDKNAWISIAGPSNVDVENLVQYSNIILKSPFIGFSFRSGRDYTFQLPPPDTHKLMTDYYECLAAGFVQRENEERMR